MSRTGPQGPVEDEPKSPWSRPPAVDGPSLSRLVARSLAMIEHQLDSGTYAPTSGTEWYNLSAALNNLYWVEYHARMLEATVEAEMDKLNNRFE